MSMSESFLVAAENMPLQPPGFLTLLRRCSLVRHLLISLPALLAVPAVLVVASAAAMTDSDQLRVFYFQKASRHFQEREYPAARIGFERIAQWDGSGGGREVCFNLGVCLDALGEHDRAAAMIEPMAPEDTAGYAPAHVWKATRLWAGGPHTPAEVRAGEKHLLFAYETAPNAIEINALLGQYYLASGKASRAVPFLVKAAPDRPELLLALARAHRAQDDAIVARRRALEALEIFQKRAEAKLDDHQARFLWADADLFLEDYPAAVAVLQRDADLKTDPRYPRALAQVYLAWADSEVKKAPSNLASHLALLERGLVYDSANIALLARFSDLIRTGAAEGDRARAALLDLQARGLATGPVRYALGLDAWEHGRTAEARLHWEAACRLMPEITAFVNNLAWALASGTDADLPRALNTINSVVARWPGDRRLRETRGQILARMKRWKEALPDLEAALSVYPDDPELHRTLALTYEQLDAPAVAAEHRRRAEVLRLTPKPDPAGATEPSAATDQ